MGCPSWTPTFPAVPFKDNDFGVPPGTTTADVFKFTGCRKVGCRSVKLDQQGGTANAHYKFTLRKVKRGVYKGTGGPFPYKCPGVNNSTFTATHTVKITKGKDGKATQVSGSSKVKIANCRYTFVNYALSGKLR